MAKFSLSFILSVIVLVNSHPTLKSVDFEHPDLHIGKNREKRDLPALRFIPPSIEQHSDYWNNKAENTLKQQLNKNRLNKKVAKNVIFFLGDGMGISTLMASRMFKGGEELDLSFEKFPYSGLSKTYCTNTQVADSACSATSYLCGIKANYGTIGLNAAVLQGDCAGQNSTENHVESIIKYAQDRGMRTGIITNTRITHATPAGAYAKIANRNWENDARVKEDGGDVETCSDIASQLIHGLVGKRLNLIFGGGRQEFMLQKEKDIEGNFGKRTDKNLIKHWKHIHRNKRSKYIETKAELENVDKSFERVLGLFDSNHMPFHLDDNAEDKPSLIEMVTKAMDILESNDDKGYFLFVEGGKIDHGHHFGLAKKALDETIEFEKAVDLARSRTSEEDTLIVVTADHSHSFTVSGYASRGNDILGLNDGMKSLDGLPYTTLGYENGPSFYTNVDKNGQRVNLENHGDLRDNDYGYPTLYPLELETHGGEDVGVFASGPHAHLFTGVYEQNFIPHAIKYIACLGDGMTFCTDRE